MTAKDSLAHKIQIVTMSSTDSTSIDSQSDDDKRKERIVSSVFLLSLTGASVLGGFGLTLSRARKRDPAAFEQGLMPGAGAGSAEGGIVPGALSEEARLAEAGTQLAVRALKRASFYAVGGFSLFCFCAWKLSGASDLQDFRQRAGKILPRIPKNDPPQSRTEFSGLNDLLQYVIDEDEKKKRTES